MRYDELRYEEPPGGEPGYDEPLDDESWYTELGRSAPSYPQQPDRPARRGPAWRRYRRTSATASARGRPSPGDSRRRPGTARAVAAKVSRVAGTPG